MPHVTYTYTHTHTLDITIIIAISHMILSLAATNQSTRICNVKLVHAYHDGTHANTIMSIMPHQFVIFQSSKWYAHGMCASAATNAVIATSSAYFMPTSNNSTIHAMLRNPHSTHSTLHNGPSRHLTFASTSAHFERITSIWNTIFSSSPQIPFRLNINSNEV